MSTNLDLLKEPPVEDDYSHGFSPTRTLALLAILIFLAEIAVMFILFFVPTSNYLITSLLDGIIMLGLIMPALYFLQLRPLMNQIEERTQAESALRTSEKLLKKVLELLPVGVWIVDKSGNVIHGNQASQEIWAGARYVGIQDYSEYKGWWPDSGKRIESEEWAAARTITRGETVLNEEVRIEAFDGTHKIMLNSAVPILDELDALQGAVVVNQDITRRREMEQELTRSNELLETIFACIDTLIAYMDRDFRFIRVNEIYAEVAGHPPEYFVGKNHFDLYPNEENLAIFRRVAETGEPFSVFEKPFEYSEYPDRGVTHWDWSLQPVKGSTGQVEGLVLSLVDVTERIRAQSKLAHQNQELLALSNAERHQRELAENLVQATMVLNTSLELDQVLCTILEQIRKTIPFQGANIMLREGNSMRVAGFLGYEDHPGIVPATGASFALSEYPLLRQVCSLQQPVIVDAEKGHPLWGAVPEWDWVHSFLTIPLFADDEVIGVINLSSELPGVFNQDVATQLLAFTGPAALALHNARLYETELTARQFAETLSAAAQALTKTLDLDHVLHTLMEYINGAVVSEVHGVGLLDGEGRLAVRIAHGYTRWTGPDYVYSFAAENELNTLVNKVITTRKSQLVTDTSVQPLLISDPVVEQIHNWLLVPIISHDKAIGLVALGKVEPGFFTRGHVQMVEALVAQAAVAIQNAWLFQQVRSSSDRLKSLARKLVEIQENERYHIARELHDEAGQALSLLKITLGRLEHDPDCPPHVSRQLDNLKGVADGVLEELHRLAVGLRPITLDHLGLVPALEQYAANLSSERLSVRFKAMGFERDRLPKDVEIGLYRIVQEALANIVRHAQAASVGILLEQDEDTVKLFVEDDGIGFDPELPEYRNRLGLSGMRERAEMFGGTLTIESKPGMGTSIIVEVPDVYSYSYR